MGRVRSRKVTRRSGEVDFHNGEGNVVLKVRCAKGLKLQRGAFVRIVAFSEERGVYTVEPIVYQ